MNQIFEESDGILSVVSEKVQYEILLNDELEEFNDSVIEELKSFRRLLNYVQKGIELINLLFSGNISNETFLSNLKELQQIYGTEDFIV